MKRPLLACFSLAACLSLLPATASGIPEIGGHHNGFSLCDEQALHLYAQGTKQGLDLGRNRIDDGKLLASGKVIPEPHPCRWRDKLDVMLHPPEPAPVPASSVSETVAAPTPTTTSVAPAPVVSSGGCPSYMAAEASSPDAVNPTSGAAGCYQILPSTAAANGCTDVGPDCAARICASQGPSAWAASGANPCPYVEP